MAEEKKKKPSKHDVILAELEDVKSLLQRTQADFVNYRRRNEEDRGKFAQLACADIIEQILPVMDNFQLAARHVPKDLEGNNWVLGIQAVEKQMEQILLQNGLEKIDTAGKDFDPNTMEAIGQEKDETQKENVVLREEMGGYMLNGKLLRPAKVIVNNN